MACGLVAGSYAGESTRNIGAVARKHGYANEAGVQPLNLEATYQEVYGAENVTNLSGENAAAVLNNIYQRLSAGDVVIYGQLRSSLVGLPTQLNQTDK